MTERKHPNGGDLYTPTTPELLVLFDRMRDEHTSWRRVCAISGTRMKVLRNLRTGKRKAVSQRLLDRLCTTTGVGSIHEFVWFTAEDLVKLGIWKPVRYMEGLESYKRGVIKKAERKVQAEEERRLLAVKRAKRRAQRAARR